MAENLIKSGCSSLTLYIIIMYAYESKTYKLRELFNYRSFFLPTLQRICNPFIKNH